MKQKYNFNYELFEDITELNAEDAALLDEARKITQKAYAPYSNFLVGAAALFNNGAKVFGTNQENASYPVGICAERVLLASASMLETDEPIKTMAISYAFNIIWYGRKSNDYRKCNCIIAIFFWW
jgi:cytidine deaminase